MYRKEIIYVGLYKNGNRMGSAGFLKMENKEAESRLFLKIQNVPRAVSGRFPIRFYDGTDWKELEGLTVRDGTGTWEESIDARPKHIRLQIILPEGYLIEGQSKGMETASTEPVQTSYRGQNGTDDLSRQQTTQAIQAKQQVKSEQQIQSERQTYLEQQVQPKQQEQQVRQEQQIQSKTQVTQRQPAPESVAYPYREIEAPDWRRGGNHTDAWEKIKPQTQREENKNTITDDMMYDRETERHNIKYDNTEPKKEENKTQENRRVEIGELAETELQKPCDVKEDKWEQILASYEKIHPYGDERVYVKLEPKDFIILQSKYQHLVNNSFLLHGFYNYRYLILGKEGDYYLGVPGVFYEREKMVALMFGFEAFECPGGSARAGEFGYYLRKVEL